VGPLQEEEKRYQGGRKNSMETKASDPLGDFGDVEVRESGIMQFPDGLGVFSKRDFRKGEVVVRWNLKIITREEYEMLPEEERLYFTHKRSNVIFLYPEPGRHVNRSGNPNLLADFGKQADVALRDILKGEELSISKDTTEDC
jgi:hypothetical protein